MCVCVCGWVGGWVGGEWLCVCGGANVKSICISLKMLCQHILVLCNVIVMKMLE